LSEYFAGNAIHGNVFYCRLVAGIGCTVRRKSAVFCANSAKFFDVMLVSTAVYG